MTKKINEIGIVLKPSHIEDLDNIITNLIRWFQRRKKAIFFVDSEQSRFEKILPAKILKQVQYKKEKDLFSKSDLIISMGGDGTLIGVCRLASSKVPIMGVNLGHLGFITEFTKNDFYENLAVVLAGKYEITKKPLFSITRTGPKQEAQKNIFFNDAVFNKNDIARIFKLSVDANSDHIYDLNGDGLIVSTTIGSTAYSLAAGGPIVHPSVKGFILSPICPHSLTHRPIVVPDNTILTVQLIEEVKSAMLTLDGQIAFPIKKQEVITIKKESRRYISIIKNNEKTYFHTLKEKLDHGRRESL